jgi:competence protein ComEC
MKFIRAYFGPLIIAIFLCGNALIYSTLLAKEGGMLTVAFLDIGQGDSIYIEAPNGNQMLIDGGPNQAVLRELSKLMPFSDRSIDVVIATHPDKDHIAGLVDVLNRYEVGTFLEPGVVGDTSMYQALEQAVDAHDIPRAHARAGMQIDLGGGVHADILFPDREVANVETNTGSIVLRLVYGENEFMLTGDSPQTIEKHLVAKGVNLESDVLKAGHHGSHTSSSENFVKAVAPQYAVISAGNNNQYGHPHKEVIDLFNKLGIAIVSTAESGTIIFTSDGTTIFTN